MVLKRLCLMVAYKENPDTASYTWEYKGGCYGNGEIAAYEKAVVGEEYTFDQVPIEVREDESNSGTSYTSSSSYSSSSGSSSGGAISSLFFFISTLSLLLAIAAGGLFAFFFFKAWKGAQAGDRMKHQEQVDEQ